MHMTSRGDALDLVLLFLMALYAFRGFRRGLLYTVVTSAGLIAGAVIGSRVAPGIVHALISRASRDSAADEQIVQRALTVLVVLAFAFVGELLAARLARMVRTALKITPFGVVDGIGGGVLGGVAFLLVAWLFGTALGSAPYPRVVAEIRGSQVLSTINGVIPDSGRQQFSALLRSVQGHSFPQLFDPLGQLPALLAPMPAPDAGVVPAALRASGPSVVKIVGQAPECSRQSEGSGFVISRDHVMTNAHVVAGVRTLTVTTPGPGSRTTTGKVVLFDPQRDVAVLYVPGLDRPALTFSGTTAVGDSAVVAGYPENGPFRAGPARISGRQTVTGPDIYQRSSTTRDVYTLRADVRPGNSGGPLLSPSGQVAGVIFAKSTETANVGYALTAAEVASDFRAGASATTPVSTQSCD